MMLGARTAALAKSGGGVPTARDYVQDGLIAMFDGVENDGFGIHKNSLTVWKNLVGENSITSINLSGNYTVLANCLHTNIGVRGPSSGTGIGRSIANYVPSSKTCEICFSEYLRNAKDDISLGGYSGWIVSPNTFPCIYVSPNATSATGSYKQFFGLYSQNHDAGIIPDYGTFNREDFNTLGFYYNTSGDKGGLYNGNTLEIRKDWGSVPPLQNIAMEWFNRSSDFNRPFSAKIHSIRIYGRRLDLQEIAANYAIDFARFNLPLISE